MNIIIAKTGKEESTEIVKRFLKESKRAVLISNDYTLKFVEEVCRERMGMNIEEVQDKIFFHLEKSSSQVLVKLIMFYIEKGIEKIFIDDYCSVITKSPHGVSSVIETEKNSGVEFTITAQANENGNSLEETILEKFKDSVNITVL